MRGLLDHIPNTPLLEPIDQFPKSVSREQWFRITRDEMHEMVDDLSEQLDARSLSLLEEHSSAEDSYDDEA